MAKQQTNWAGFGLKLLGTLAFLYLLYTTWHALFASNWWATTNPSVAEVLLSGLWGLAGVLSVSLLLMTLASAKAPMGKEMVDWARRGGTISAFCLFALAAVSHNSGWGWVALLGYVLLLVGAAMDSM
ncbi:MAG: hypothetical protein KGI00_02345 [Candidatus Micrarchaeota archaeon]|nr:hypothetical protein [Candidatus Micrarchaeota archaeon]MDE1823752.1 hypothetical protein [Candidatus Micrarchaeota archaeon]MDE1849549.1 hypothetical protein [Candidatus Micrarchaeota archaeon]